MNEIRPQTRIQRKNTCAILEAALDEFSQHGFRGTTLDQIVNNIFETVGFTPTIGTLLIIFVICMTLKAFLVLVTSRRGGYMIARVVTDLRIDLIQALFDTRWEYFVRQPIGSLTNSLGGEAGMYSQAAGGPLRPQRF